MSVVKILKHEENFLIVDKEVLNNSSLSFKAKGLWAYCMGLPNNWKFHLIHLATVSKENIGAVRSGIDELIESGYAARDKYRLPNGQWNWNYTISEKKLYSPAKRKAPPSEPEIKKIFPDSNFRYTENPYTKNCTLPSIDIPSINVSSSSSPKTSKITYIYNELTNSPTPLCDLEHKEESSKQASSFKKNIEEESAFEEIEALSELLRLDPEKPKPKQEFLESLEKEWESSCDIHLPTRESLPSNVLERTRVNFTEQNEIDLRKIYLQNLILIRDNGVVEKLSNCQINEFANIENLYEVVDKVRERSNEWIVKKHGPLKSEKAYFMDTIRNNRT